MKLSNLMLIGALLVLPTDQAGAQHAQNHKSESPGDKAPFVVVGKLIDATWFTSPKEPGEGEDQTTRAANRMASGTPAAVLPEGAEKPEEIWYLLTSAAPLAPYAGKQVKVEGRADRSIRAIEVTTLSVKDGDEWREVQVREVVQKGIAPQKTEMVHPQEKGGPASTQQDKGYGESADAKQGGHEGMKGSMEGRDAKEGKEEPSKEHGGGAGGEQKKEQGPGKDHEKGPHDLLTSPPAHPILVNFTAGLFPAAVLADWLGRLLRRKPLHVAGWWMLLFAAVVTPFTALAGWDWYRQVGDMDHWQMTIHPWLGTSLAILVPAIASWRGRFHFRSEDPSRRYLVCATFLLLALILQGHLGGTMSFPPHGQQSDHPAGHAH